MLLADFWNFFLMRGWVILVVLRLDDRVGDMDYRSPFGSGNKNARNRSCRP